MHGPLPAKDAAARSFDIFQMAAFTIGAKMTNTINVAVQLQDALARSIAESAVCRVFLSDAITGLGITATALTSAIAIGTNGFILDTPVSEEMVDVQTDAQGRFDLNLIQTASPVTYYMVIVAPDGSIIVSGAITF